jgi:hypothetical protein
VTSPEDVPDPQDRGFNDDAQARPEVEDPALIGTLGFLLRDVAHFGTDGVLRMLGAGGAA